MYAPRPVSISYIDYRGGMARRQTDIVKGTLDLLVLKTLALEPRHGVGVSDRIAQITRGTFQVKPGSLFPALHRLEQAGLLSSQWVMPESGRRRRIYALTGSGTAALAKRREAWEQFSEAVNRLLVGGRAWTA
jgi:transcriptional regulator